MYSIDRQIDRQTDEIDTVSFHNFKSQNFKLSVSNPKSKYVAYLSVLSRISNCQGLGRKNKHDILKTDRRIDQPMSDCCSHGTLLHFGLRGSHCDICCYHRDLHLAAMAVASQLFRMR